MKDLIFTPPRFEDCPRLAQFFFLRPNKCCETAMIETFIWKDYYKTRCCIYENKAVLFLMENDNEFFTAMPLCREEDLAEAFSVIKQYFQEVLHCPLRIYLADREGIDALGLMGNPDYIVTEQDIFKDYLYDGEALRTLVGRKYHQKKNYVNRFEKEQAGRWRYRSLSGGDGDCVVGGSEAGNGAAEDDTPGDESFEAIEHFLDKWYAAKFAAAAGSGEDGKVGKDDEDDENRTLLFERQRLREVLRHRACFDLKIGAIEIDGQIEAIAIGTYNPRENMAIIDVEKANAAFPGIYQMINREFLLNEFPGVPLVNREDDAGVPGLRKAKESYHPVGYVRKYIVIYRGDGSR